MTGRMAWGYGLTTTVVSGPTAERVLDTWYPEPMLGGQPRDAAAPHELSSLTGIQESAKVRNVRIDVTVCEIDLDAPPADARDAYLRLHLLSHRLVPPRGLNLEGIFGVLPNIVWTSLGPCPVDDFDGTRLALRRKGPMQVYGVDKFPRMVDYVVPHGVRIADGDRVRLGAHLADGTTVMHEGFVNYNAGSLGPAMIEGRVSAGVVIGEHTDVGGGASIMGTLSGGGKEQVTVGRRCLIGANAGIGISLGDDCVVEAGTYVTAGSKVTMADGEVVKAATLSGRANLQFWRNSVSGALEARPRSRAAAALNEALHDND